MAHKTLICGKQTHRATWFTTTPSPLLLSSPGRLHLLTANLHLVSKWKGKSQPPLRIRTRRFQALAAPAPISDRGPVAEGSLRQYIGQAAFGTLVGLTALSAVMGGFTWGHWLE